MNLSISFQYNSELSYHLALFLLPFSSLSSMTSQHNNALDYICFSLKLSSFSPKIFKCSSSLQSEMFYFYLCFLLPSFLLPLIYFPWSVQYSTFKSQLGCYFYKEFLLRRDVNKLRNWRKFDNNNTQNKISQEVEWKNLSKKTEDI